MLEEVPAEDLQAAEQPRPPSADGAEKKPDEERTIPGTTRTTSISSASTSTTATGRGSRRRSRSCRRSRTRSRPKSSLADHLMWQLNAADQRRARRARLARRSSATSTTTATSWRRSTRSRRSATGTSAEVERALEHVQSLRPDRRGRARPAGVPAAAAAPPRPRRHAGRDARARPPAAPAESPHPRARQGAWASSRRRSRQHIEVIRHLDPKPGARYSPADSQYVIPDVYIVKTDEGYRAVLNEDGLPQLRISPVYRRLLDKGGEASDETRAYVKDKFRSALWLLKSVDQRQKTILKVATSIINFQRDVPRPRHRAPAAARAARRGQRHRHARVDGVARGEQQVHAHAAGRVRDEVLLPQRHQQLVSARASRRSRSSSASGRSSRARTSAGRSATRRS